MAELSCLSYWYPKIRDIVPTPATEILQTDVELIHLLDGKTPDGFRDFLSKLRSAADRFGYPCFLRTGQGSGKHNWKHCCHVTDGELLDRHIAGLVEWSCMVDMMGLSYDVWVVREMLATTPLFHCTAYGDMPVVKEFRAFVDGAKVLYVNPYWPEDALEQGHPDRIDWRSCLPQLVGNQLDLAIVENLSSRAGAAVGGKWSVDVLFARDQCYVTDMAEAERSWGWDPERSSS